MSQEIVKRKKKKEKRKKDKEKKIQKTQKNRTHKELFWVLSPVLFYLPRMPFFTLSWCCFFVPFVVFLFWLTCLIPLLHFCPRRCLQWSRFTRFAKAVPLAVLGWEHMNWHITVNHGQLTQLMTHCLLPSWQCQELGTILSFVEGAFRVRRVWCSFLRLILAFSFVFILAFSFLFPHTSESIIPLQPCRAQSDISTPLWTCGLCASIAALTVS